MSWHGLRVVPETAIPWKIFNDAEFEVIFATENGKQPSCDDKMLSGVTGALLGATRKAKDAYQSLIKTSSFQSPLAWTDASFDLNRFDLVFLPGGHEKSVRQVIDSSKVHQLIASYFPKTKKPSNKSIAAICHGVQVLASSSQEDGKSVIHDAETTALPTTFEESIFQSTRIFLGDYYKTYGAGSPSVQRVVTSKLDDPSQFKCSLGPTP